MGAWGSSLYANDVTCDVKDTYMDFLKKQKSNIEAYEQTIAEYKECIGDEDEPLLWYALADTQWSVGRLMPEVKEKALLWIKKGGGLALWEESKNGGAGWKKTLNKLESKLNSTMPPEKIIKKPVQYIHNPWNVGDFYAYQFNTEIAKERGFFGKYVVFQKIGDTTWYDGEVYSVVKVFNKIFNSIPTYSDVEGVRALPFIDPSVKELKKKETKEFYIKYFNRYLTPCMLYFKKRHYPKDYFHFIGNQTVPEIDFDRIPCKEVSWEKKELDDWISNHYSQWENEEY